MRLLERDAELAVLGRIAMAARHADARFALVRGPAGIGRSALLRAAARTAPGVRVLWASGTAASADEQFGVARALLGPSLATASAQQRRALLDDAAAPALAALELADRPGWAGPSAHPPDGEPPLAVAHGLYWFAANLSAGAPLLMVVDDAHLADRASLRWLTLTCRRLSGLRIALLLAARSGESATDPAALTEIEAQDGCEVIRPRPLSVAAVRVLLVGSGIRVHGAGAGESGGEPLTAPDVALAARVHAGARGNPGLVHAVLHAIAGPHATLTAALDRADRAAAEARALVGLDALSRQPPSVRAVAEALAVLGDAATPARSAALAGVAASQLAVTLDRLAELGIADGEPALIPERTRAGVLAEMTPQRRAASHAEAATLLHADGTPPEQIAPHLVAAGGLTHPWVSETLRAAAEGCLARGAAEEATAYLRQALACPAPKPDLPGLLARLGAAEVTVAANAAARHLGHALELTASVRERAEITSTLCDALVRDGRSEEAAALLDRMIAEVEPADRELGLLLEAQRLVFCLEEAPDLVDWNRPELVRALTGATAGERAVLSMLALLSATRGGSAQATLALARRGLSERIPDRMPLKSYLGASSALLAVDRPDEAEQWLTIAMSAARAREANITFALLAAWRARARLRQAKLADAVADAEQALGLLRPEHWHRMTLLPIASLVDALTERGDYAEAAKVAGIEVAEGAEKVWQRVYFLSARGRMRAAAGDPRGGLEDLLAAGRHMLAWGRDNPAVCAWRSDVALVDAALGNREHALRMAEEELALARSWGTPRTLAYALRATGLAAGGQAGLDLLEQAARTLAGGPDVLLLAHVHADLGAARHAGGDKQGARAALRRSLEVAQRAGAQPLATRAQRLLIATGARPRRPAHVGVEALTDSERRVAVLASQGRTNREIADTLFVRQRTIEIHLTSAYRKLGISSRSQLPTALRG